MLGDGRFERLAVIDRLFFLPGIKGEARRAAPDRPPWAGAVATSPPRTPVGVVEP